MFVFLNYLYFKTPLASILIASNYANSKNEIKENPKLFKYIQIIINQSNKLNQHIEKILYVAKTDSNQIVLEKTKVDITKLSVNEQEHHANVNYAQTRLHPRVYY